MPPKLTQPQATISIWNRDHQGLGWMWEGEETDAAQGKRPHFLMLTFSSQSPDLQKQHVTVYQRPPQLPVTTRSLQQDSHGQGSLQLAFSRGPGFPHGSHHPTDKKCELWRNKSLLPMWMTFLNVFHKGHSTCVSLCTRG